MPCDSQISIEPRIEEGTSVDFNAEQVVIPKPLIRLRFDVKSR
jgi:hypothetical protein